MFIHLTHNIFFSLYLTNLNHKMDTQKVDMFLMTNAKYFDGYQLSVIREKLITSDDSKWSQLQMVQFKDPTTSLIVSLLGGSLGIDRFIIGDTGLGVAKLITCGGLSVWTIIDWFLIMPATKERNFEKFHQILY